jgi:gamma-glutamyltranspeptidase/glutathione hydrolase
MKISPCCLYLVRTFAVLIALCRLTPGDTCRQSLQAADAVDAAVQTADESSILQLFPHAVVAADHPLASQAGVEIMKQGGNVVDAAVATAFALSVVRPASCGLGGGGFMVIWNAQTKQAIALDYRERAPLQATRLMYGEPSQSRVGHLAIAVPGNVAGLCFAVERYGRLDIKRVVQPAIRLARDGVLIDAYAREAHQRMLKRFSQNPQYRKRFRVLYQKYLNGGKPWEPTASFHSPQLRVLELIAERGADGFYRGPVARALLAEIRRGGGVVTQEDFDAAKPTVRKPLRTRYVGFTILAMPPPSSGGIAMIQALNTLTAFERTDAGQSRGALSHNSPDYVHLMTEAMKHVFADRATYLGDADFVDVPVDRLTSEEYAIELAGRITMQTTRPTASYGRHEPVNDGGTSHLSVIDAAGNAVACTETINTLFGSFVVEPEYGIVLNNEMDDFSAIPGRPNAFGLVQSKANAISAGKRPLSSMSPIVVLQGDRAVHALGASGGPRIISATIQVLMNLLRFGMQPDVAINHARFHHQWLPNELLLEQPLHRSVKTSLEARGHVVRTQAGLAVSQVASRGNRGVSGASDPRRGGRPEGF